MVPAQGFYGSRWGDSGAFMGYDGGRGWAMVGSSQVMVGFYGRKQGFYGGATISDRWAIGGCYWRLRMALC